MNTELLSIRTVVLAAAFILRTSSFLLAQGPLTPPGAPAPTMKTLDQLDAKLEPRTPISALPFTISASGSYYVTGNLTTTLGGNGITISATNGTLDLSGFELVGNGAPGLFGIRVAASRSNVVIRNGTVRNWPGSGVVTENTAVSGVRVEMVRALANGSAGIALGTGCLVADCLASGNAAHGISTSDDSQVLRCTSRGNTPSGDGIQVGGRCAVRECVATGSLDGVSVTTAVVQSNITVVNGAWLRAMKASTLRPLHRSTAASTACSPHSMRATASTPASAARSQTVPRPTRPAMASTSAQVARLRTVRPRITLATASPPTSAAHSRTARRTPTTTSASKSTALPRSPSAPPNSTTWTASRALAIASSAATCVRPTATPATPQAFTPPAAIIASRATTAAVPTAASTWTSPATSSSRTPARGTPIDWVIAANNVFGPIIDRRSPSCAAVSGFSAASSLGSTDANANYSY